MEDEIVMADKPFLEEIRPKIHAETTRLIADLKEVTRRKEEYERLIAEITIHLDEVEDKLGERSPKMNKLNCIVDQLLLLQPKIIECEKSADILSNLCPDFQHTELTEGKKRFEAIGKLRSSMAAALYDEIEEKVSFSCTFKEMLTQFQC